MAEPDNFEDLEAMYDDMFAYRYTDEDEDYVQTTSKPIPPSPCVTGYFVRSRQNYDNRGNRGRGHSDRGHYRQHDRRDYGGHGNNHHGNHYQGHRGGQGHHGRSYNQQDRDGGGGYRDNRGQRYNPY